LVAAASDNLRVKRRPAIFVEHGAGQTYEGAQGNPSYAGGAKRDNVVLFLCPNDEVAMRNLDTYPNALASVVGCPKLDRFLPHSALRPPPHDPPVVAFTFHADLNIVSETRSAFSFFAPAIDAVADAGYDVLGHAHPRAWARLGRWYASKGIPAVPQLDEVFRRADVLVVDNSSAGVEFAAIGKRVVWCSPPWYRPEVHHGGRFWEWIALGGHALAPEQVVGQVHQTLGRTPPAYNAKGRDILASVYTYLDGKDADRAAQSILRLPEGG
jgi:hypothetical protein